MNSPWQIELFGGLQMRRDGEVISRFQTRKTAALLAYLSYHRDKATSREVLADVFWPDNDPEAGRNSLRVALNSLRRQLEPPGVPPGAVLIADRSTVRLNPVAFVTDVAEFETSLRREKLSTDDAERTEALLRAVERYRGPLLSGWYEEWIDLEQARLTEAYGGVLRRLTTLLFKAGKYEQALEFAQQAVHADPLREEMHRLTMRLYAALGRPADAREQYQRLEQILRDDMGAAPSTVTRELLKQITSGEITAVVVPLAAESLSSASVPQPASGQWESKTQEGAAVAANGERDRREDGGGGIPLQFTKFFGRDTEIASMESLLASGAARLVTLTGPGGTGKTRLAIEIAVRYRANHGGRAWVALMSELTDSAQVGPALLSALHLAPQPDSSPLDQITSALGGNLPALIALDNLEQMTEVGAEWARLLLDRLPNLQLIVTSRQCLGLTEEQEIPLSPLPIPEISGSTSDMALPANLLADVADCPSVALFLDRARAVRADFQITPRNAGAIAELCRRLDGLPLAVELAAAWVRLLSPAQMLERLTERYDLLTSDRREFAGQRQRSLRAVMDESWRLMPEELRPFFASLSVFHGGWTLDAAQAICLHGSEQGSSEYGDVLEMTDLLQRRSLVAARSDLSNDDEVGIRFDMLEMVRRYADTTLTAEDRQFLREAHRLYYVKLAERAGPLLSGPDAEGWRARLESEHDNLRAALTAALDSDPDQALAMTASLWRFWYAKGHASEGQKLIERALSTSKATGETRAAALHGAGRLALSLGNASLAAARFTGASEILAGMNSAIFLRAMVSTDLTHAARAKGDHAAERAAYEELVGLYLEMGDGWSASRALDSLADVAAASGDNASAKALRADAVAALGDDDGVAREPTIAGALLDLGSVAVAQGDYAAGLPLLHESLTEFNRDNDERGASWALERIAVATLRQKEWSASRSAAEQALLLRSGRPQNESMYLQEILAEAVVGESSSKY